MSLSPHPPLRYFLLMFMAATSLANGLLMVTFTQQWYLCIANPLRAALYSAHFVTDVGTAYLTIGAALLWAALRPARALPLVAMALLFSALHAVHHVGEYLGFGMPTRSVLIEIFGIWGPVAILAWLALDLRRAEAAQP
ncbi:hypothetical protein D0B54_10930 [Solimonas sp. K1W22B-7]|uniref:hypothetical protein n=1 Tax=Solimonas sp. K1W22B-7 TaxID=2303331 RepID=UPI000E32FC84|nr:hypothetical protein [Solimonas sp. K1W22B-7]AXQ29168.1 hypothetical protein D0B54_10930 [Solimonas sp. K1W22B-7]